MRIQLMITLVCLVLFGINAQAGAKKTNTKKSVKYETIGGKKYQVEKAKIVKAGPLIQPESAKLRRQREQMEMATEEEFIQKLEQARMDDERIRRQEIFEKKLRTTVSEDADPFLDSDLDEMETEMDPEPVSMRSNATSTPLRIEEPSQNKYYISLNAGGLNHQAGNVPNMNGSAGVSAGLGVGADFWIEGGFTYSFLETERGSTLPNEDIDMFNFTFGPKYTFGFSNHWVTPVIGVLAGFTRRQYDAGDNASNALDAGIVAGVELALNRSVKIGLEGRYMTNLDYEKDKAIDATDKAIEELETGRSVQPLEEFDYSLIMANMKMVF